jgi:hypothetical protein
MFEGLGNYQRSDGRETHKVGPVEDVAEGGTAIACGSQHIEPLAYVRVHVAQQRKHGYRLLGVAAVLTPPTGQTCRG